MADNYSFKEAFTDAEKVRRALQIGTDGDGNPIVIPVVASGEDQTGDPISFVGTNDGRQLQALELDDGQGTTGRITRDGTDMGVYDSRTDTTLADQSSYDGVNPGPATDSTFSPPYNAIVLASVDGDISIENGEGNDVTLPQGIFTAGQPLQVTVAQINSTGTTQTVADIVLLRE